MNSVASFLDLVEAEASKINLSLNAKEKKSWQQPWLIDHVCYRVESDARYGEMKQVFGQLGTMLVESMVSGRLIATYKLHSPIRWKNFVIPLVELPAPKKGKQVREGWEHLEIVVQGSFAEIKSNLPGARFDEKGLSKKINPELELELDSGVAIKFHHQSLEQVIEWERKAPV